MEYKLNANIIDFVEDIYSSICMLQDESDIHMLTPINECKYAIPFLLNNPKYITYCILKNENLSSYIDIKYVWDNRTTIFNGAIKNSYNNDYYGNIIYNTLDDCLIKKLISNVSINSKELCRILGITKEEFQDKILKNNLHNAFENTNMNTDIIGICKLFNYNTLNGQFLMSNVNSYDLFEKVHSCAYNGEKLCFDLDIHPSNLNTISTTYLYTFMLYGNIETTTLDSYLIKYYHDIFVTLDIHSNYELSFDILKRLDLTKKENEDFVYLCIEKYSNYKGLNKSKEIIYKLYENPTSLDFFKKNAGKYKINWMQVLNHNKNAMEFIHNYCSMHNMSVDDFFSFISNKKIQLKITAYDSYFELDYDVIKKRIEPYKEELMMRTWSPKRIEKLLEYGIDPDDF